MASRAPTTWILRIGRAEIMSDIIDSLSMDETSFEEAARLRPQAWGIQYGMSLSDRIMRRARLVGNQSATGTISIHTAQHLPGKTDRLCVCPERDNVNYY